MAYEFRLGHDPPDEPWFWVPTRVGEDVVLPAILDPLFPRSIVSLRALNDLLARSGSGERQLVAPIDSRRYLLRNLNIQDQPIPDIEVYARGPLSRHLRSLMGADMIIGFSFFQAYTDICFNVPAGILTVS